MGSHMVFERVSPFKGLFAELESADIRSLRGMCGYVADYLRSVTKDFEAIGNFADKSLAFAFFVS